MLFDFTEAELAEARAFDAKLDKLPRFRMETVAGRLVLNALLRIAELVPLIRGGSKTVRREQRTVEALGRTVKLRIFRPMGPCRGIVVDFHGGGWTIGNARMSDGQNDSLVERTGVAVVSVDYRLALSATLREVIDDCAAGLQWALSNARAEFGCARLAVVGGSAGAHLAACALLRLRDRASIEGVAGAILYFGLYDLTGTPMVRAAGPETLLLHGPTVRVQLARLTPDMTDHQRRSGDISPVHADLTGLPPALFLVGAKDMLVEDSERMAAAWATASGNADLTVLPELPHAFLHMDLAITRKVQAATDAWLLDRLAAA